MEQQPFRVRHEAARGARGVEVRRRSSPAAGRRGVGGSSIAPTMSGQRLASPAVPDPSALRVALLSYRGNPYSGGQGVYVRQLSAALTRLGHEVTVFSGQPYPDLEDGVAVRPVPSLDLYRADDPFRTPRLREFRDWIDVLEFATCAPPRSPSR